MTSKGIYLTSIGGGRYVLEDVFGICTLPFHASDILSAAAQAFEMGRVSLLCQESELDPMSSPEGFRWFELEKLYVSGLTDHFRYWQVGSEKVRVLDVMSRLLPSGYEDLGFGEGSGELLEKLHNLVKSAVDDEKAPFTSQLVAIRLSYIQLRRICSDLMALIQRSVQAFTQLLRMQRETIFWESNAIAYLNSNEIIHTGPKSYMAATNATMCVISLCTSLDISTKLLYCLNACAPASSRFKTAQGKQFSELDNLKPGALPQSVIDKVLDCKKSRTDILSLIQLRHDLIHNTTALDMERIYVGFSTGEINELPLHYSYMPWRDCLDSGQPVRCLGRDYFTSSGVDLECQIRKWILTVIDYHIQVGAACLDHMKSNTVPDVGVRLTRD